ncbi:PIG-P-domain-containing [Pyrrhoderma noxium]|uniref:PIG-P-domain-containing n=1 Tax=Pyrrhoderma noxium TaxID=2282107 RepID=A0A286U6P5_9AGAM|nr:PIG-P-domain-containing [Pyrrhoderma noxium]
MDPTSPRSPLAQLTKPEQRKSRAPEFYGFVAWSSTYTLFILYVLWALLPDTWIVYLGIEWYPNREWAILLPAYSVVLILLTYFTYWALALYNTPDLDELSTITDTHAHIPSISPMPTANPYLSAAVPDAIPAPFDIPIGLVNRVLYAGPPALRAKRE